jgi:glycosyltransferase involved in cell wall biosynthesis
MRAVRAAKDSDLIITNTFWAPVFAKLLTNSKVWVSAHRFPKKQYFLYKNVDLIQPVSKSVAKGICQQTPSVCELVKVLPNFIKSEGQNPKLTDKKKTILFVGRVHPEKGVEHLIKAFSEIPNHIKDGWQLKIIGPFLESQGGGGEDYLSTLKKLAAADIKFTGPIFNKDQLNNEYLRASVFVYPSVSDGEAFGLAPIEALAFGCQTIVSDLDCFDDYLIHGKNGYKCNLNNSIKSELSDTLIKVIQQHSTDSHQTLINNSCKTAQNFDLKIVSKLFAEQIKSLVNENS